MEIVEDELVADTAVDTELNPITLTNQKLVMCDRFIDLLEESIEHQQQCTSSVVLHGQKCNERLRLELTEAELWENCEAAHKKLEEIQSEFNEKFEENSVLAKGCYLRLNCIDVILIIKFTSRKGSYNECDQN